MKGVSRRYLLFSAQSHSALKGPIILCIILSILLVQFTGPTFMSQSAYATKQKVILFDQVHLQYYTSERMHSALNSLNNTESYIVFINHQRFTRTALLGVDILVIGNPERPFTNQERVVISEYLRNGGNLFLLSDPRTKFSYLNEILDTAQYTDASFSKQIIFDEEHNLYDVSTQISVSREDLRKSNPIVNGVQKLVTHAIWVESNFPRNVVATGSNYSYAGLEGSTKPPWLIASIVGRSHIVLCGSTRMFSDLKLINSDVTWYQSQDNARLWHNIFLWLAQKETAPFFLSEVTPSSINMMVVALVSGIVFIGGGVSLYYLFQRKGLKPISEVIREKKIQKPTQKEEPTPSKEEKPPAKKEPSPPKKKKKGKRKYRVRR